MVSGGWRQGGALPYIAIAHATRPARFTVYVSSTQHTASTLHVWGRGVGPRHADMHLSLGERGEPCALPCLGKSGWLHVYIFLNMQPCATASATAFVGWPTCFARHLNPLFFMLRVATCGLHTH